MNNSWMVSFGLHTPDTDKYKPRVRPYKNPYLTKSNATRKLLRGIKVCLNSGVSSNDRIYEILEDRGFLNRLDGKVMTKHTLRSYARAVRAKMGIVRKDKKTLICELFLLGKSLGDIAIYLESTPRYVTQTLRKRGHEC